MKEEFNEIGIFTKNVLKDKILVKLRNDINYLNFNIIGKNIYDLNGRKIGKILDVVGNIKEPYALAMLDKGVKISNNEKIFVSFKKMRVRK
ncbi:MAG: PRC-barrel domain-containing protein [Saccharolobus sp.]|jgi:rRNA processing protein Gar1|uniref:H/ACA RNA-protein complex protein Gar1 n=1 Tax=Saccharolobus caldissimus TaxID=1702097 RepID=A0AAQ4CPT2_9CREN|nr:MULTISPECIES: PRC-barrel domain-containing protein [Saccharolobus]MDT7861099.1 PRC-barrel domain-containing protein [Saccharolobus sp.]BDB97813.1 H/ACA RNA-protein complex protein Gar1 [Saccharolobus caldissimus]